METILLTKFWRSKIRKISSSLQEKPPGFCRKLRQNYGTERILAQLANYGIPNKLAFQIQDL